MTTISQPSGKTFFSNFSLSSSTKKDLRKVESAILLGLLLLPGLLIALPAVSAFTVSAYSGAPATVTGATAAIDYPIIAGVNSTPSLESRVVTISNPAGNPGITTITISVPAAAVSAAPTGSIPIWGGVPDCATPNSACQAAVFGSGPYSLQYTDTLSGHTGAVILPGGASISLVLSLQPEKSVVSSSGADQYSISVAVEDSSSANTVLNSLTVYELASGSSLTVTGPSSLTQTAGSTFSFSVSSPASGLPVVVGTQTRSTLLTSPPSIAYSPASFTTGTGSQTIVVNDTVEETFVAYAGGPQTYASAHSSLSGMITEGSLLGNGTTSTINVQAGTLSQLTVMVNGYDQANANQINVTSTSNILIPNTNISVSTTDKYGNTIATSPTSVTLTVTSIAGETAGFTTGSLTATYPYTPATLLLSVGPFSITGSGHPSSSLYVGPDYGSNSFITATSSGLSGTSLHIVTYSFSTGTTTVGSNETTVPAGSGANVTATLPVNQAGVPMYFVVDNSTAYAGTFSGAEFVQTTSVATASGTTPSGPSSSAILMVDTTTGASTSVLAGYYANPATRTGNGTLATPITTVAGPAASLVISSYFDSGLTAKSTSIVPSGSLYLNVAAADAYGNTVTQNALNTIQVSISTSSGALSLTTAYITTTHSSTAASGYTIQYVAPSAVGTSKLSASAIYNGVPVSGTTTISIVSSTPTLVLTSTPTTVTTGTPQSITGWANVSAGINGGYIKTLQYSLNGANYVTIPSGAATNQFTITVLLKASNIISIGAVDNSGNMANVTVNIPPLSPALTFTNTSSIAKITFPNGGPQAVNATFTNNSPSSLTVLVIGQAYQNVSGTWVPLSPPISSTLSNVPSTGSASGYLLLQGYAPGTYKVVVTVYSLQYVTYSQPITVYVTVS